jgi:hypothetical protein
MPAFLNARSLLVSTAPARVPVLDLNFLSGTLYGRLTFTRASSAWAFNSSGVLASHATDVPRFDYDLAGTTPKGLLVEEARTNSLRNNSGTGAAAGTPGTLPTNWTVVAAGGLTTNVVAVGTENGIPYTDIQIVGTTNSTQYVLSPESLTQVVASNTQAWTCSGYVKQVAGSTTNITNTRFTINGRTAAGSGIGGQTVALNHTLTSTLTRASGSFTMSDATVARVSMEYRLIFLSGVAVDITVRLGGLQLELGAFVTSPILTTSAAATRAQDVCTALLTAFPYNAPEGTLFVEAIGSSATNASYAAIDDASTDNQLRLAKVSTTATQGLVRSGASASAQLDASPVVSPNPVKFAVAYRLDDFAASLNGGTVVTDTLGAVPAAPTTLRIGSRNGNSDPANAWIKRVAFYNRRLDNAKLQRITA